ncbi:unnamed protein product [Clonostachys rosea]|uniref:Xylanolytic transcriptional activator regulatory domain-containing protein n=1 Tax=Bionectria ochroleuca TaxID=29856 RepID=A0ABY6TRF7_BIOOC|nr:unnamed protein product [Clonostachys rosea]
MQQVQESAVEDQSLLSQRLDKVESKLDDLASQLTNLSQLTRQVLDSLAEQRASDQSSRASDTVTVKTPQQDPPVSQQGHNLTIGPGIDLWWLTSNFRTNNQPSLIPAENARSAFVAFFKHAHGQPYTFFHEHTFWKDLDNGTLPDHLLFAVLSHSVRFTNDDFFRGRALLLSRLFANISWKMITTLYFQDRAEADLATVKTITLLSISDFTSGCDTHASAWLKIGLAVRIAQDLRLMIDDPLSCMSNSAKEERRRVFWSVYTLDRLASCARARPPAVVDASCYLPLPCDEELWRSDCASNECRLDEALTKIQHGDHTPSFPALVVVLTSILCRCTQSMLQDDQDRQRHPPWDPQSDFAGISSDLLALEGHFETPIRDTLLLSCSAEGVEIDPGVVGSLIFSRTLFCLCHCLLNHPFLLRRRVLATQTRSPSTFISRSLQTSREYATRLVQELNSAQKAGYHMTSSFYAYASTVAASIHVIHMNATDEVVRDSSSEAFALCYQLVTDLSRYWPSCELIVSFGLSIPSPVAPVFRTANLELPESSA